jgi:hypothetical protein
MRRILILVEGQTEERFVKDVLQPFLWKVGVHIEPKIATTKRVKQGADFKGGVTSFHKIEDDIRRLIGDSNASLITTMIDYYGLPGDFPKIQNFQGTASRERARALEMALEEYLNFGSRFLAYFMVHEFEALLFSQPAILSEVMNVPSSCFKLQEIRDRFSTPEEINDSPETRPSARILNLFPSYRKRIHGPITSTRIGLETMRQECSHFNEWCIKLEKIGSQ